MVDDLFRLILVHLDLNTTFPIVVTGSVGAGKTVETRKVASQLKQEGYRPGGLVSPRVMRSGRTVGYDVIDLDRGKRKTFVRTQPPGEGVGRFFLKSEGLEFARETINQAIGRCNPVFVDEVGRLELDNRGLASSVFNLLDSDTQGVYLVRGTFLPLFREEFKITQYDEIRIEPEADSKR